MWVQTALLGRQAGSQAPPALGSPRAHPEPSLCSCRWVDRSGDSERTERDVECRFPICANPSACCAQGGHQGPPPPCQVGGLCTWGEVLLTTNLRLWEKARRAGRSGSRWSERRWPPADTQEPGQTLQPRQTRPHQAGGPLHTAAALWPWEGPIPRPAHSPQPGPCPGEVTSGPPGWAVSRGGDLTLSLASVATWALPAGASHPLPVRGAVLSSLPTGAPARRSL